MAIATPPPVPQPVQSIIPAFPYEEYQDDPNIVALFEAYNTIAQSYLNWFLTVKLGDYTSLSNALLDWIAEGLYGMARPSLPSGSVQTIGPLNTWTPNQVGLGVNMSITIGAVTNFTVTDDIFKRILTWHFFKGDGMQFCIEWFKRRCMRFLTMAAGASRNIDNTYPISVAFGLNRIVTVTITLNSTFGIALLNAQLLQAGIASGALATPFQYTFVVNIVNNLTTTNLTNVSGILHITTATGWPTSATGLAAGKVWANGGNGGVVTVVPGVTPNPFAAPQIFGLVTSATLLTIGGGNLPLTDPHVVGQLWNNSNVVTVSAG